MLATHFTLTAEAPARKHNLHVTDHRRSRSPKQYRRPRNQRERAHLLLQPGLGFAIALDVVENSREYSVMVHAAVEIIAAEKHGYAVAVDLAVRVQ